jgi:hypothetical protein
VKDPESFEGQEEIWRQSDINLDTEMSKQSKYSEMKGDSFKTNDLMNQYSANNRGIPNKQDKFFDNKMSYQ